MEHLAALAGVVLMGFAVAGVPEHSAVALIVGGLLALAPTVAKVTEAIGAHRDGGGSRPRVRH